MVTCYNEVVNEEHESRLEKILIGVTYIFEADTEVWDRKWTDARSASRGMQNDSDFYFIYFIFRLNVKMFSIVWVTVTHPIYFKATL